MSSRPDLGDAYEQFLAGLVLAGIVEDADAAVKAHALHGLRLAGGSGSGSDSPVD